jgi:hypothetical protein
LSTSLTKGEISLITYILIYSVPETALGGFVAVSTF